jgi:hypothetical protein
VLVLLSRNADWALLPLPLILLLLLLLLLSGV